MAALKLHSDEILIFCIYVDVFKYSYGIFQYSTFTLYDARALWASLGLSGPLGASGGLPGRAEIKNMK